MQLPRRRRITLKLFFLFALVGLVSQTLVQTAQAQSELTDIGISLVSFLDEDRNGDFVSDPGTPIENAQSFTENPFQNEIVVNSTGVSDLGLSYDYQSTITGVDPDLSSTTTSFADIQTRSFVNFEFS